MEEVFDVALDENEVKIILDDHGNRIQKLEIDNAYVKEKLNSISAQMVDTKDEVSDLKSAVARLESTVLTTNNSILTTLTQVVTNTSNNQTQVTTTTSTNKKDIIVNSIKIGGSIVAIIILGLFAAKGISVSIPIF